AGAEAGGAHNQGFVARFTAAGALDGTFGANGVFADPNSLAAGTPSVQFRDLAFGAGGSILVAGDRDLDAEALKLTAGGAPDAGFGGGDGIATSDFAKGPGFAIATGFGIAVDSQGRVLLSGQTTPSNGDGRGTVVRFTAAGALDTSWGSGTPAPGIVWLPAAQMGRASGVLVSAGDRVVFSGQGSFDPDGPGPYGNTNAPSIARLTAAGTLDPAFGSGGVTVTGVGSYANGFRLTADPVHQRLLVPGSRMLQAPPYDVRPFVLAYGDDGSASTPPPSGETPAPASPAPATPAPVAPAGIVVHVPSKPVAPKPAPLTITQAVSFPPTKSCASRRKFGIRLRVPKGVAVKDATVSLNGKRVAVRKGSRLRSTVNLLHLPKGTFTVAIQLRLADGTVLKGSRKYHTCAVKKRGGKPKV
ncbi:MAG: enzyme repeat protein, partial [Conexibacter sp.]|nr:enzyme repeat protein [Conexibacter sp.]